MRTTLRLALASLAFSIFCAVAVPAAGSPFTLEQVLSAPFPSELVAAPSGGAVAWVFDARGARNIWIAEPPEYRGRSVTSYRDDDGQEISDVAFTQDGRTLVYVRGGDANRSGDIPNPALSPEGADQAVYVIATSGGAPRRLGEGHSPAVSPKDGRVAFVSKGQVFSVPLAGSDKPSAFFKTRGEAESLRWSPDGARLAFVSRRGDHSFVGIFDPGARTIRYLDPSVDRDQAPTWSPDGSRVAFVRVPSSRALQSFRPHREAAPWSVRVSDASTSAGREVFRAAPGKGSVFRGVVARDQILWADGKDGNRLVFPWERDGWTHLYAVTSSGGAPALLTPGDFEVEYVSLSADRRTVLFNSNQGDIDRRHLWRVSPSGGPPVAITSAQGIEWSPVGSADGRVVAFLQSDAKKPPRPAIWREGAGIREIAADALPGDFPESALVVPEAVVFPASDGMKIHGQLFLPPGGSASRHPAAIFFHGGSRRQMLVGWHYNYYYRNAYAFNQYLASRGFVVLSVNYRSGIGYGMEFREALDYGATGASEFRDVTGAGQYLKSRSDVDPAGIGLWGGSYGGYLTALGLARSSDVFAAGVDFHGVHDWNLVIRNFEPTYDPEKNAAAAKLAFDSSPLAFVESWRSPVLLIHGDDDRNVPFGESVNLAEALRGKKVEVEQLIFPDEVHDFLRHENWLRAYRAADEFLERRLRK